MPDFRSFGRALLSILKLSPSQEIVKKSLDRAAGIDFDFQNPDKLLQDLTKDLRHYDAMMLDDRISSGIKIRKRLVLATPYNVRPASQDPRDIEIADEIQKQLGIKAGYMHDFGYSFRNFLDNALDSMVYGFKVAEKVLRIHEDKLRLMNIKFRHSIFFDFNYDEYGNLDRMAIGMNYGGNDWQNPETNIIYLDDIKTKFMIFVWPYPKDGNYYGQSELNSVYTHYRSKCTIQKARNIFLEKWGQPIPEIVFDAARFDAAEQEELDKVLRNWQEGTYLKIPGEMSPDGKLVGKFTIQLHEVKTGSGTQQFENAIDQLDKQIWRALLFPDKLGFSESPGGSYNQSEVQFDILKSQNAAVHAWIEDEVNRTIKQLVDYNYTDVSAYPVFEFQKEDQRVDSALLKILIDSGVVDKREQWIRKYVSIPDLSAEERAAIDEQKKNDAPKLPAFPFGAPNPSTSAASPRQGEPEQRTEEPDDDQDDASAEDAEDDNGVAMKRGPSPFNAEKVLAWYESQENAFSADYLKTMYDMQEEIISFIERKKIIENKDLATINKWTPTTQSELKNMLIDSMMQWYLAGKMNGKKELRGRTKSPEKMKMLPLTSRAGEPAHCHEYQIDDDGNGATCSTSEEHPAHGHEIKSFQCGGEHRHDLAATLKAENWSSATWIDEWLQEHGDELSDADRAEVKAVKDRSYMTAGNETDRTMKKTRQIIDNGLRSGKPGTAIIAELRQILSADRQQYALTIARTNMSTEYNNGRMNFFNDPSMAEFIVAYRYDAIMDDATTEFCAAHDGQVILASDPQLPSITPPNHFNCRSTLVPITAGEMEDETSYFYDWKNKMDPWGTDVPASAVKPAEGFGG